MEEQSINKFGNDSDSSGQLSKDDKLNISNSSAGWDRSHQLGSIPAEENKS